MNHKHFSKPGGVSAKPWWVSIQASARSDAGYASIEARTARWGTLCASAAWSVAQSRTSLA